MLYIDLCFHIQTSLKYAHIYTYALNQNAYNTQGAWCSYVIALYGAELRMQIV